MSKKNKHKNHKHMNQSAQSGNGSHEPQKEASTPTPNQAQLLDAEASKPQSKARAWNIAIAVTVIVAIVLILLLSGRDKAEAPEGDVRMDGEAPAETADDILIDEALSMSGASAIGSRSMEPVTDGEFTYTFSGIDWVMTPMVDEAEGTEETQVAFYFDNFMRREGVVVEFGRPYKLGTYAGTCEAVDIIAYDANAETGTPLGFATCRTGSVVYDFVIFQEGDTVVPKRRDITMATNTETGATETQVGDFFELYTIPLASVVR